MVKNIILALAILIIPATGFCEETIVVATEPIIMQGLMGLAGCIVAGLFWFGIIKNI